MKILFVLVLVVGVFGNVREAAAGNKDEFSDLDLSRTAIEDLRFKAVGRVRDIEDDKSLSNSAMQEAEIPCKITKIIDGDTVRIEETFHGLPLSIRVLGVDTPEKGKKAKCLKEAKLGEKATEFTTTAIIHAKTITCEFVKHDKFGGRLLGHIYIDGVSLADSLIKAGLAREYYGEKKKSWCD